MERVFQGPLCNIMWITGASQVALAVKKRPADAGDAGDMGSIPGSGRFPGGGNATHSSILAWRESHGQRSQPGGLWSIRSQRINTTKVTWHVDNRII